MVQTNLSEDTNFLAALAVAMVEKPRANLNELASAIGVSKATLYRYCRTRNELVERLIKYSSNVLTQVIENTISDNKPLIDTLKLLANNLLAHSEFTAFLTNYCQSDDCIGQDLLERWTMVLDDFFLRGQQSGIFRIDIAAATLTELWMSIIIGFIEAERRGRIARANLSSVIVTAFLQGTMVK